MRKPSPSMVIALIALFVALGGTGYAAVKINGKNIKNRSIAGKKLKKNTLGGKQIKESKLKTVPRAKRATTAGSAGTAGFATSAGFANSVGSLPRTLPSGQSLQGAFANITTAAADERVGSAISFTPPLAHAPTAHFIKKGTTPPSACPGTAAAPKARPGQLCIFEAQAQNVQFQAVEDPLTGETGSTVQPWGAEVVGISVAAGDVNDTGSWAVTAP